MSNKGAWDADWAQAEIDRLTRLNAELQVAIDIHGALNSLLDTSDDPDVQDAIGADLERMERESQERRKAENAALVRPLVEALTLIKGNLHGAFCQETHSLCKCHTRIAAAALVAYRKTEEKP